MNTTAIRTENLTRDFKTVRAVENLSSAVMWKELKELSYLRGGMRGGRVGMLIFIVVFGIFMPIHPNQRMPMQPFGGRVLRVRGFTPLLWLGRGLFQLGILALIVLGVVYLFRALRRPEHASAVVAAAPPATTPVESVTPTAAHTCGNCARAIQADWTHCPYCGAPLKQA
jgi:hypothetical protein